MLNESSNDSRLWMSNNSLNNFDLTEIQKDRKDRETERQKDRNTERQKDRKTERQKDRKKHKNSPNRVAQIL